VERPVVSLIFINFKLGSQKTRLEEQNHADDDDTYRIFLTTLRKVRSLCNNANSNMIYIFRVTSLKGKKRRGRPPFTPPPPKEDSW
jgi:hypothetical protein